MSGFGWFSKKPVLKSENDLTLSKRPVWVRTNWFWRVDYFLVMIFFENIDHSHNFLNIFKKVKIRCFHGLCTTVRK